MSRFDLKEIVTAWAIKFNPKPEQKELAEKRAKICNKCEHPIEGIGGFQCCDICNCIISAKIYSPKENPCPLKKWKCDISYFHKNSRTRRLV